MIKAALLALVLSAITPTPSEVYMNQYEVIVSMQDEHPTVDVDVRWFPCGQENAFYWPSKQLIGLCTEMHKYPGAAVFFAAHEMGHAITHQLLDTLDENAADEIAALAMIDAGMGKEVLEAALWFKSKLYQSHIDGDTHPPAGFRAWELACLVAGSDGHNAECVVYYKATKMKWSRLLPD